LLFPDLESKEVRKAPGPKMGNRHFVAVHTDSGCILGCDHKHQNIATAAACISEPGGYIVAVRRGKYLPLTDLEEAEFQEAMFGHEKQQYRDRDLSLLRKAS